MLMDGVTGEVSRFEDDRLNFHETFTVVVKSELYAFNTGRPV